MPEHLPREVETRRLGLEDFLQSCPFGPSSAMVRRAVLRARRRVRREPPVRRGSGNVAAPIVHYPALLVNAPCWFYRRHPGQLSPERGEDAPRATRGPQGVLPPAPADLEHRAHGLGGPVCRQRPRVPGAGRACQARALLLRSLDLVGPPPAARGVEPAASQACWSVPWRATRGRAASRGSSTRSIDRARTAPPEEAARRVGTAGAGPRRHVILGAPADWITVKTEAPPQVHGRVVWPGRGGDRSRPVASTSCRSPGAGAGGRATGGSGSSMSVGSSTARVRGRSSTPSPAWSPATPRWSSCWSASIARTRPGRAAAPGLLRREPLPVRRARALPMLRPGGRDGGLVSRQRFLRRPFPLRVLRARLRGGHDPRSAGDRGAAGRIPEAIIDRETGYLVAGTRFRAAGAQDSSSSSRTPRCARGWRERASSGRAGCSAASRWQKIPSAYTSACWPREGLGELSEIPIPP